MDPLSDVLSLLKPRSYSFGGFDAGGEFSVQFPAYEGIKCYAVVSGQRWLSVDGVDDPVHLTAGDCALLASGRPFRFASNLTLTPTEVPMSLLRPLRNGGIAVINGGGDCFTLGGHFLLSGAHADMLLGALPPIVHIRKEADKAAMRWSLERMMQELSEPQPGGFLLAENLAYLILVQALRLHLAEGVRGGVGWLFALADKQISRAITALHEDPARRWTLQELAEQAGLSRSPFAQRFKTTVGVSAMEYLTSWRMLLAADRLTTSADSISEISSALGYESESAFSAAFKRVKGCSPRRYGRHRGNPSSERVALREGRV